MDRDCLLEMIGVDPFDPRTQTEYHRRQGYNNLTPPFCIRSDVCANLRHFFFDCPSAMSDEDYANIWGEWAQQEEFKQMKIWDNNDRQTHKTTGAAGPVSFYTPRNLSIHMPKNDSTPTEATILEHVPSLPNSSDALSKHTQLENKSHLVS